MRTTVHDKTGARDRETVDALLRGLEVLRYLNRIGIATNTLVAKRFDLKVSTAHRMLMVLARMGMLRHDARGHQFMLASNVRRLSAGFRESGFVDNVALPRMRAWTRRHGMRLLLVSEDNDNLIIRASTAANWPLTRELPVAGNVLAAAGSSEAEIFRQTRASAKKTSAHAGKRPHPRRRAVVRTMGAEIQISVMIRTKEGFRGSLSIRCSTDVVRSPNDARHWAAELKKLAASITAASNGRSLSETGVS
jgi:DNA-binding IclR family transcriptional regulator